MKPRIAIIGANDFQNQLILKAKEKGYETHVFAWKSGAIGEKTADFFYPISIIEKEQILAECERIKPEGIISIGSDLANITVSYVAEKMGLVGNGIHSSLLSTNKYQMRKAFKENGLPSPKCILVKNMQDLTGNNLCIPMIVKPTDRSGSRGIYKVRCTSELEFAVERALKESFEKKVLVEEFVEGKEYSVEFISYGGEHHFLAMTQKYTTGSPKFIETGHLEPAEMATEQLDKIVCEIRCALDALEIKNGASHAEVKVNEKGDFKIIEIGGRMGGDCIGSDLVELSTGFDYVGMVVDVACSKPLHLVNKQQKSNAFVRFIFSKDDVVMLERIRHRYPELIVRVSEIEDIDENSSVEDSSQRYGYYLLASPDRKKLLDIINEIYKGQSENEDS